MRLFIATDLPADVLAAVAEIHEELEDRVRPVRWVRTESMHLTLKFIGEVSEERAGAIAAGLALVREPAVRVAVSGVGFFPNERAPRVFWAGVVSEGLPPLAAAIEKRMAALGFEPERRAYNPHLTLARARGDGRLDRGLVEAAASMKDRAFGEFTADRFYLYESRLERSGAVYTKMREYPLEGA